jgi:hypothetical protein
MIGKEDQEPYIECDDCLHDNSEKDNWGDFADERIDECNPSEDRQPPVHGSRMILRKEEKRKNGEEYEGCRTKEVPLVEEEGDSCQCTEECKLRKDSSTREEEESRQGKKDDPAEAHVSRRLIVGESSVTDSTDPVWIVPNVLIKTGSVNKQRGSATETRREKVAAVFKTNATLHWG